MTHRAHWATSWFAQDGIFVRCMYRQGDMFPSFKKWNVTNQEESFQPIPPQKVFYRSPCKNIYTIYYIIYPSTLFFIEIHKLRVKANCPQKKKVVKQASQTQERITTLTTLAPTTGGLEASHFSLCKMDLFICVTWLHPCGILPGSRPGGWHNICHLH